MKPVDLPILAYDIPFTAKVKVELETMLTLAEEGTVIGAKGFQRRYPSASGVCSVKRPQGI